MRPPRHIHRLRQILLTGATTLVCVGLVAFCAFGVPAYEPDSGEVEPQLADEVAGDVSAGEEIVGADEEAAVDEAEEAADEAASGKKAKKKSKKGGGAGDEGGETDGGESSGGSGSSGGGSSSGSGGAKASGSGGSHTGGSGSAGSAGSGSSKSGGTAAKADPDTITVTVIVDSSRAAAWGWPDSLANMQVSVPMGSSVYDALCATGLKIGGTSSYVSSIGGLAERACGSMSGWLYYVDGEWASKPAGSYILAGGETIQWIYTCNNGSDVDL